ncbi:hypothetical protein DL95DRAFT_468865 [Leptodontidium sp. 2 PMI_412]|nr:hypothetical protein DL95DRAFT_468865 [Leptodontidium sp. 2 PMI_412]
MEALPSGNPGRNEALFQTAKWWLVGRQDCGALPSFTSVGTQALPTAGSNGVPVAVGGRISPLVNVDHVWEMKFLNDFLGSQLSSSSFDCDDLNAVFMANDQARPTSATPQPRLQTIFDQLPGNQFPDFAGMLASTNNIKGTIFTPGGLKALKPKNSLLNTQTAALFTLQDIFIAFSMCNDPDVAQLFRNTNTRMFEAFQGIDEVITNGCFTRQANGAPISATFASAYSTFMDQRISTANREAFAFATSLVSGSLAKATGTDAAAVARFTNSPLFTASNFAFNFNLVYTGTTPLKMRSLFNRAEACPVRSSSSTLTTQLPTITTVSSSLPAVTAPAPTCDNSTAETYTCVGAVTPDLRVVFVTVGGAQSLISGIQLTELYRD